MDPVYIVLLLGVGFTAFGIVGKALFDWMSGRRAARAEIAVAEADLVKAATQAREARTAEFEAVIKQLIVLINELRTARDRDREDAQENRVSILELQKLIRGLEAKVRELEGRITALLEEAKVQSAFIAEQRERLRGAGVEPPAEPEKLEKSDG